MSVDMVTWHLYVLLPFMLHLLCAMLWVMMCLLNAISVSTIYGIFVMYVLYSEYEINPYPEIQLLIESQSCLKIQEEVLNRGVRW